jgi:hypothetical protein
VWIKPSLIGAFVALGAVQAEAGPAPVREAASAEAPAARARFSALPRETPCAQARRKLWLDGRGWVVRRVSICR